MLLKPEKNHEVKIRNEKQIMKGKNDRIKHGGMHRKRKTTHVEKYRVEKCEQHKSSYIQLWIEACKVLTRKGNSKSRTRECQSGMLEEKKPERS